HSLASGLLYAGAFGLYTWAITRADVSLIAPFLNLNAVFVVFLARFAHGEEWGAAKLFGLALIVAGGLLINAEPAKGGTAKSRQHLAQLAAIGYALLSACARLVDKAATDNVPLIAHAAVTHGLVAGFALAAAAVRGQGTTALALAWERPLAAVVAGLLNALAFFTFIACLQVLPVSVVEPLSALAALVAVVLGGWFYREPIRRRLPGAVLICLGAWAILQR
ncbi:MAG TPA: EamA family transporter, partial [Limnochordia bacterium]|nr:EamA family transporter [Limnochordia bacterium]